MLAVRASRMLRAAGTSRQIAARTLSAQLPKSFSSSHRGREAVLTTPKQGIEVLQDPTLNKGTGFTQQEKDRLGVRGLVPPRTQTMDFQARRVMMNLNMCSDNLEKYVFLSSLQDRNETLFFKVLMENFEDLAPIVYTPTVGEACLKHSHIFRRSRGMYFSKMDRDQMAAMVYNWPSDDVDVIVVTDGSRILGLGDLGANGMQIPIGKLNLYVAGAGISPLRVLPVVLDLGTNNKELIDSPLYVGVQEPRPDDNEFFSLVDEMMIAFRHRWPNVLVQFEDFSNPHAFQLLDKYRNRHLCFNDDIQSTGAIALSGVLASLKARGKRFSDIGEERIVCVGAGSAGLGVCETLVKCMVDEGCSPDQAYSRFYILDQHGLFSAGRSGMDAGQARFARRDLPEGMSLENVVKEVKPTVLLGLSGAGGTFNETVVREMAAHVERPVIFPLSNPTKHAECSAEEAAQWTEGRAIFASGSPFSDVDMGDGKVMKTNQCNNSYCFPGMGLGIVSCGVMRVTDSMFQAAARRIAEMVTDEQLAAGQLFPRLRFLRTVSLEVAAAVAEVAYAERLASVEPPKGLLLREFIKQQMWSPEYIPLTMKKQ